MSSPISPIVAGMMNAFTMAGHFKDQQRQNEYLALAKQQEQRQSDRQQFQQQMEQADLATRLNAMGARPATASDDLEAQTGTRVDTTGVSPLGPFSMEPSDIKGRLINVGGNKYVLPNEQEQAARADRASERETKRKVAETTAVGEAKTKTAIAQKQAELDNFGIPFTDEAAKMLGVKPGTKYRAENIDDIARAVATITRTRGMMDPNNPEYSAIQHAFLTSAGGRQTVAAVRKNGQLLSFDLGASPEKKLTPLQQAKEQKDAQTTAVDGFANQVFSDLGGKLEDPEKVQGAIAKLAQSNPFVAQNQLRIYERLRGKGAAARKPTTNVSDADVVERGMAILNGGQSGKTAAPAGPAAPGPTSGAASYLKKWGAGAKQ